MNDPVNFVIAFGAFVAVWLFAMSAVIELGNREERKRQEEEDRAFWAKHGGRPPIEPEPGRRGRQPSKAARISRH